MCPESWSWQHFLDGALPKLYHALPVIRLYNATVLIQNPRDSIVLWILNRIPGLIFEIFEHGGYSADIIIDPCNTPFMNTRVWRGMQKLINPERAPSQILWDFVLFVRRSKTRNGGRKILNEEEVVQTLNYNGRGVVVDPSDCNTDVIVNLMQQTKLVVGVHGGAMFNIIFANPGTKVVEIFPFDAARNKIFLKHSGSMVYAFSALLNMPYTRMMANSKDSNVYVSADALAKAIFK